MTEDTKPIALVTGASRGIGAAAAKAFATAGMHVILTARTEGALEAVEEEIHAAGGTATIAPFDLTDGEAIDRLAQAVATRWGWLDVLLMNAAILGDLSPLPHVEVKLFEKLFALNVTANFRLIRAFDPLLRASEKAHVVAVTSSVAEHPRAYWGPYAASKAALANLTETYAQEVREISRIRASVYNPGATATAMRAKAYPGENPATIKAPEQAAAEILALLK